MQFSSTGVGGVGAVLAELRSWRSGVVLGCKATQPIYKTNIINIFNN